MVARPGAGFHFWLAVVPSGLDRAPIRAHPRKSAAKFDPWNPSQIRGGFLEKYPRSSLYTAVPVPVLISLLRAVNLGPHNRIKMDALCRLYEALGFNDVCSYVQSGNVLFRTSERASPRLAAKIEAEIEKKFGFRPPVILRTTADLREVIARNPFANRGDIEPNKFLVVFLAEEPSATAAEKLLAIKADPEEVHLRGRELYIYYPNGLARPKLPWTSIEKAVQVKGTARNWNSVTKLLAMAEEMERTK